MGSWRREIFLGRYQDFHKFLGGLFGDILFGDNNMRAAVIISLSGSNENENMEDPLRLSGQ